MSCYLVRSLFLALMTQAPYAASNIDTVDSPMGNEMLGIQASAAHASKEWKGWLRIPLTTGSDVKRCIEGLPNPERTVALLIPPRRNAYRENPAPWLSWCKEAVSLSHAAGIRHFQAGSAGLNEKSDWTSDPDTYFKDLILPCQHMVKEWGGKVVFSGAPWPEDGMNASRWIFDYGLHDTVDILMSTSVDKYEWEYLHYQWIASGKCDSLWIDCTQHSFSTAARWVLASHQFLLWTLKKRKPAEYPAAFFLPQAVLTDEHHRRVLALEEELLDGPLSFCESPLFVQPGGEICPLMVGQTRVVATIVDPRFPVTVSSPPCQDIQFENAVGISMLDGKELSLKTAQRGTLLSATLLAPPKDGFLLRFWRF